jgi:hypothetical protein
MNYEKKAVSMILALTLLVSIMLSLSGCGSGKSSTTSQSSATAASNQPLNTVQTSSATNPLSDKVLVKSTGGDVTISVPSGWNTNDTQLYPGSVIGVADDANNEYLIITQKPKLSLKAGDTINDYLNIVKTAFGSAVTNPVWGQPSSVTIGGCKGLTVRLTGTRKSNSTDTVYFVNVLESKNYFYNVCGYTLTSVENTNKTTLQNIINSFKEKD